MTIEQALKFGKEWGGTLLERLDGGRFDRVDHSSNPSNVYFESNLLAYGDYDNSCEVERANVHYIRDNHPEWYEDGFMADTRMMYGSESVVFRVEALVTEPLSERAQEVIDMLHGLADYPALDDEAVDEKRAELIAESRPDFVQGFRNLIDPDDEMDDAAVEAAFDAAFLEHPEGWHIEPGGVAFIKVEELAAIHQRQGKG